MVCDRFAEAIKDRARGSTLPADAAAHLAVCERCRAMLDIEERVMATISRALTEVASTTPAPDFVSRVREHVERAPRWLPSPLMGPPVVAALALLLAAVAVSRLPNDRPVSRQTSVTASVGTPLAASGERMASPAPSPAPGGSKRRVLVRRQRVSEPVRALQRPEILIPAHQREAVDRLFASVRAGRPDVISMLANAHSGEASAGGPAVVIEPLRIEPVVVPALALSPSIDNK
jgi:hypothetical protein